MATGMGDTGDVHGADLVKTRHGRFETPKVPVAPKPAAAKAAHREEPGQPARAAKEEPSLFENSKALQLLCNPALVPKPSGHINTLYWSRGLSLDDRMSKEEPENRMLIPFVFSGEILVCKAALLCRADCLSPGQVAARLQKRRVVVHVDGHQNMDTAFLGARKALVPAGCDGGTVGRLNAVFVVHIKDKSQMSLANLSVVSMFAGPKATVAFRAQDTGTCYAYWGTPGSVIPFAMSSEVNPEWPDFPSLLDAYLASDVQEGDGLVQVPSHGAGTENEIKSMRAERIDLGPVLKTQLCFDDLQAFLEAHRESDYDTKESIVLHLFAFEFLLSKEDMEKVKGMVRSIFKSALSSKERIDFFNNIKSLSKSDRDKIRHSAKLIERLANRLCCRKYVSVNRFLAEFQEKLAQHGQKGAEKMELGQECLNFCKQGDPLDLFETERDFMLVSVEAETFQAAVRAAGESSQDRRPDESPALAWLDPRTPVLDSTTVASLLSLGIPHELEAEGAMQCAIPVQEGAYYGGRAPKSLVFLPIFPEICPDLTQFDYTVWAYALCEALKGTCLVPREMVMKPRQVEYAVLQLLVSFMKSLCAQRTTPVDPASKDVDDTLVKKIRSVYWLIRAVMLKNVGVMTPEPICSIFSGKANHVFEIEIALEVLPLMCKTGLGAKFVEPKRPALTEVFLRALYGPLEDTFKGLLKQHRALTAQENEEYAKFFMGAVSTDASNVTARLRPKKCSKCLEMLSIHEFPRQKMIIEDASAPAGWTHHAVSGDNLKMCLKCNGFGSRPTFICPCKHCDGKKGSIFQFSAQKGSHAYACHHECIGVPKSMTRQVPPMYCKELGLATDQDGAGGPGTEMKLVVRCSSNSPLVARDGVPSFRTRAVKELALSTSEVMTGRQLVMLGARLGLFSPETADAEASAEDRNRLVESELRGILILMLNSFTAVPPWKEIVPDVVVGKHLQPVELLPMLEAGQD